jgi:hypothetical protein
MNWGKTKEKCAEEFILIRVQKQVTVVKYLDYRSTHKKYDYKGNKTMIDINYCLTLREKKQYN